MACRPSFWACSSGSQGSGQPLGARARACCMQQSRARPPLTLLLRSCHSVCVDRLDVQASPDMLSCSLEACSSSEQAGAGEQQMKALLACWQLERPQNWQNWS